MHRLDARSKIIMLAVYSVSLFFIETWAGMACAFFLFAAAFLLSRLPARKLFGMVKPVYVIAAIAVVCNSCLFDYGAFSFSFEGFSRGCFFAFRILLLVWASLVVCLTSTSTQLTEALNAFLRPLRPLHVPTDDIAMVFSIALRFIPLTAEEFIRVKNAQWSRGASFDEGGAIARVRSYSAVLVPMFVGLFRRADALAQALDMRCYGMPGVVRTSIAAAPISVGAAVSAIVVSAACICAAVLF